MWFDSKGKPGGFTSQEKPDSMSSIIAEQLCGDKAKAYSELVEEVIEEEAVEDKVEDGKQKEALDKEKNE